MKSFCVFFFLSVSKDHYHVNIPYCYYGMDILDIHGPALKCVI